jgi:hypothetical protein
MDIDLYHPIMQNQSIICFNNIITLMVEYKFQI